MQLPVAVRRPIYRVAYRVLQVIWFVTRPDKGGVKCVLTHQSRVLLVRHTYGRRAWDLPGGAMKRGEPPLSAARREMREELGVDDAVWNSLGALHATLDHRNDTLHLFQAELGSPAVAIDRGELSIARWFEHDRLPADLAPYVVPILARAPEPRQG
jgi:8-oxo-dGTP pyrophosphatase MutT (NUDIX family)